MVEDNIKFIDIKVRVATRIGKIKEGQYISFDDLLNLYDELVWDYEHLQEEFNDYKNHVEDNYKPIPYKEQIGED